VLVGSLLAVGGQEISEGEIEDDMKEVYIYSPPTNSWIYISDLPAPRSSTTVAILSKTELLTVGGWSGGTNVQTVYMGTLMCTMSL
jgi:N-acetylneuraminic acid mutarotase